MLFTYLGRMHDTYKKDLTLEEFSAYVLTNCMEKDREVLADLLSTVECMDVDTSVLDDVLRNVLQRQQAYTLALASLEVSEGRKEFDDLLELTKNLSQVEVNSTNTENLFVTDDLEELLNDTVKTPGLRWRLQTLNRMLGSLRRGDFGFIFARPETGKTTFLASEVTGFAHQIHQRMEKDPATEHGPILWFNNEEGGGKVKIRLYQGMLGIDLATLQSNVPYHYKKYMDMGGSLIKLYDNASINKRQVEMLCRDLKPSLVIFDQIDKIKGFDGDREDLRLGSIYVWAREIAKEYCPVIGVSQADASGEGKKWLNMDNVANAKTAKQAEADWILGIGKTHAEAEEYTRFLHLSKNKLTGDIDSDPDMRHGREAVMINATIARYEDLS